jgi:prolyl oligopeptidase
VAFVAAAMAAIAGGSLAGGNPPSDHDPYLWLSDIEGARALGWVKAQNAKSDAELKSDPNYAKDRDLILASLNADDRIPDPQLDHEWVFNFWQDAEHVRGVWRRAPIADYAKPDPNWQVLFDVDKYDRDTGKNWVWQGADCTPSFARCLVRLSPGGTDAAEVREFDPKAGAFVDDGFALAAAKSNASYIDNDTILFATDFGPGSMTPSSYPRIVKLWHRGEKLSDAKTVFEGQPKDDAANITVYRGPYGVVPLIVRRKTFFTAEHYVVRPDGSALKLPLPDGADVKGVSQGQLIFTLRDAWRTIPKGSLVSFPVVDFMQTGKMRALAVLYTPGPHAMIAQDVAAGRDAVFAPVFENVIGSIHEFRFAGGKWSDTKLDLPRDGSTGVASANDWGPEAYFTYQSFTQPPTLYQYDGAAAPKETKSEQPRFDASTVEMTQHWVASKDGVKVPYFLLRPKGARGPIPTILYGYGGFELSLTPWYWNDGHRPLDAGQTWLGQGGAIAVANIRGGGEFGPAWHQAALKANRQKAFDDFAAVARDLERRKLTTPHQLGIVGASNGGVLTTVTMTQHPELLRAVVCQRPLVDMLRYTRFGAGQSWVDEYGDPAKPAERAFIAKYSAYQNVKKGVRYPSILFITETTDDRVTPTWARMMAAKMEDQGHDVLFNEAAEGGHGPGATHAEAADYWALSYAFFKRELGLRRNKRSVVARP